MAYKDVIIADNPSVYFRFNETGGSVIRDIIVGAQLDLGFLDGGRVVFRESGLLDDPDTAIHFDKGSARGILPLRTSQPNSMEAWFLSDPIVSNESIIITNYLNDNDWSFRFRAVNFGGQLIVDYMTTTGEISIPIPGVIFNDGQIYHIVHTYDGSNILLYVNGVLRTSRSGVSIVNATTNVFAVANQYEPIEQTAFDGIIDELSAYRYALTESQVVAHYEAGINPSLVVAGYVDRIEALNPLAYWRLGEPSGNIAVDRVGGFDAIWPVGGDVVLGVPGLLVGDSDTAYEFSLANGPAVPITSPDPAFAFGTGDFSFEMLITTPSLIGSMLGLSGFASGLAFYFFQSDLYLWVAGENIYTPAAQHGMVVDTTYRLSVTRLSGTVKIYVDAIVINSMSLPNSISSINGVIIGDMWDGSAQRKFEGVIDELVLFNYALTQNDITDNYNAGLTEPVAPTEAGGIFASVINTRSI